MSNKFSGKIYFCNVCDCPAITCYHCENSSCNGGGCRHCDADFKDFNKLPSEFFFGMNLSQPIEEYREQYIRLAREAGWSKEKIQNKINKWNREV